MSLKMFEIVKNYINGIVKYKYKHVKLSNIFVKFPCKLDIFENIL